MSKPPFAPAIASVAMFLLALPAAGQDLEVGAEVGVNVSDFDVEADTDVEPSSTTGFRIGAVARLRLGPALGLEGGIHYSEKGARIGPVVTAPAGFRGPDVAFNGELRLRYLEAPLLLAFEVPTGGPVTPRLLAGGLVSLEVGCVLARFGASRSCEEVGPDTRAATLGAVVGGGLDVALGPGAVTVAARYEHGLTDVIDDPEIAVSESDQTLRSLALSAGYVVALP